jgi:glycine cleavage system H protein
MVAIFVLLTIMLFLTIDYFVQRRQVEHARQTAPSLRHATEIAVEHLPSGVFLDRGFTWSSLHRDGEVTVGVNELPVYVLGDADEIEVLEPGSEVKKGQPMLVLSHGGKDIVLPAPMDGTVSQINYSAINEPEMVEEDPYGEGWLVRLSPANLSEAVSGKLIGERARTWMRDEMGRLRDFLANAFNANPAFATLQDGGMPVKGFAEEMNEEEWKKVSDWFSNPESR